MSLELRSAEIPENVIIVVVWVSVKFRVVEKRRYFSLAKMR